MNWKDLLNSNRPRPSTGTAEHRSQFERDYDRCAFSTPVKRLQDKAQVFPLESHDGVRTRLTHSLEVSSVARGIGVSVGKWLAEESHLEPREGETIYDVQRSIETICATCGLIHDLGNPPFGHAGEYAIQDWFSSRFGEGDAKKAVKTLQDSGLTAQQAKDLLSFDGNAQTIRLVAKLQVLADFNGLNLTWGTLSALRKYTSSSLEIDEGVQPRKKAGHFASENDLVDRIKEETGVQDARNPLTFLVEAADDIVYSVADVEDAVKKKIISWRRLEEMLLSSAKEEVKQVLERKASILKPSGKAGSDIADDVHASAFRTAAISFMVPATVEVFQSRYSEIMDGTYHRALVDDSTVVGLANCLTDEIGQKFVYATPATLRLELMGRNVIHELMDLFWDGIEHLPTDKEPKAKDFNGKAGALLSSNYKAVFRDAVERDQSAERYSRFQLLTDYICGMTDTYCKHLHSELFNG